MRFLTTDFVLSMVFRTIFFGPRFRFKGDDDDFSPETPFPSSASWCSSTPLPSPRGDLLVVVFSSKTRSSLSSLSSSSTTTSFRPLLFPPTDSARRIIITLVPIPLLFFPSRSKMSTRVNEHTTTLQKTCRSPPSAFARHTKRKTKTPTTTPPVVLLLARHASSSCLLRRRSKM